MVTEYEPIKLPLVSYIRARVNTHKLKKRKLLKPILSDARRIDNAAAFLKLTRSRVTWVGKFIQADGGHFE